MARDLNGQKAAFVGNHFFRPPPLFFHPFVFLSCSLEPFFSWLSSPLPSFVMTIFFSPSLSLSLSLLKTVSLLDNLQRRFDEF